MTDRAIQHCNILGVVSDNAQSILIAGYYSHFEMMRGEIGVFRSFDQALVAMPPAI
jgi:hypothetical protein